MTEVTLTITAQVDVSKEAMTLWVRDMLNYHVPPGDDERSLLDAHAAEIDKLDEYNGPVTVAEPRRRKRRAVTPCLESKA
jgi:hypothetical protein